ncbi:MAG: NAD(P)-dependent oxidoreductase [Phycisphaerae bacterium]|nr:NAD(P)-dependent oxidoreductase [Phycisphaerae bacterium]
MRIAMTGAHGFIGSYAARALAAAGHEIVALVRDPTRAEHSRELLADMVVGDMRDLNAQERLCRGAECVIHAAADWEAVQGDNRQGAEVNLVSSLRLLETARLSGAKQFILISSISAYGEILEDRTLDENHPTWPGSQYGAWKAATEPYLKAYHIEYGLNTVSLRPAGVNGIDPQLSRSWWHPLVRTVMDGERIDTTAGGKMVHVLDCAEAVRLCVGNSNVSGRFFNLVDCYVYDQHVAEIARRVAGSPSDIVEHDGRGPKHQFDVSAARALGVPLDRGLAGVEEYVEDLIETMR